MGLYWWTKIIADLLFILTDIQESVFVTVSMEVYRMADNGYTQKEMLGLVMEDIDKIYSKLEEIQNDLATRPTRQEIYGWIIAGISIATLITVLM